MEDHGLKGYGPFQWRSKPDDIGFSYAYFYQWIRRKDNGNLVAKFIVGITNPTTESEIKEEIREAFGQTDWPWAEYPEAEWPNYSPHSGYYLDRVLYGPYNSPEEAEGKRTS